MAGEIRKLAEGSSQSAGKIAATVKDVLNMINSTARLMAGVRQQLKQVVEQTRETQSEIRTIAGDAVESQLSINKVAEVIKQQSEFTRSLEQMFSELADTAEQTAATAQELSAGMQEQTASVQEINALSEELPVMAEKLNSAVKGFRL